MKALPAVLLLLFSAMLMGEHAVADHELVLVVRADSDIEAIDLLDVRKVYLGFSVRTIKNAPIRAAANLTEKPIFEIFLQDVMAMSASTYDRRLLTLTLQSGYLRPAVFRNLTELVDALKQDPNTVSFMWKEDAEAAGELKVLRVLWRE